MATKRNYGVVPFKSPRLPGETRVYTAGDSMAQGLRDVLHPRLTARGYVVSSRVAPGTGLLDDPYHAMRDSVIADLDAFDPDAVVFYWRGNYRQLGNPGLPGIDADTPAFYSAWTAELVSLGNAVIARKAQVFFVLGASMLTLSPDPPYVAEDNVCDRITRTIATNTRTMVKAQMGKAGCVEAYNVVPDPWERYVDGVEVRTWDGLHLAAAGNELLADYVERAIVPVVD